MRYYTTTIPIALYSIIHIPRIVFSQKRFYQRVTTLLCIHYTLRLCNLNSRSKHKVVLSQGGNTMYTLVHYFGARGSQFKIADSITHELYELCTKCQLYDKISGSLRCVLINYHLPSRKISYLYVHR